MRMLAGGRCAACSVRASCLWPGIVITAFACLATIYSVVNPILESLDEIPHYGYIEHLMGGGGLPVQRPGENTVYEQEGSQPPLYYALGALLLSGIDVPEGVDSLNRNPHALIGIGLARENRNVLVHSESEGWPWRGLSLAVHMLRLFSVTLGALTVWGIYRLGRLLFPTEPALALGGMAFAAFNPMFIYLSSSINNDNLVICLSTWVLVGCVQTIQRKPTLLQCVSLGTLAGLAAIAKVSGALLIPFSLLALAVSHSSAVPAGRVTSQVYSGTLVPRIRNPARYIKQALVFLGVASMIAGWWYVRNLVLYGELTGTKAMLSVFGTRNGPITLQSLFQEYKGFRMSYWGLLGAVNIVIRPGSAYILLETIFALGVGGAIRWIALRAREQEPPGNIELSAAFWASLGLLVLWIVALHVSLLRWTSLTYASQARLIFPALGALSLLVLWGLCAWFPPRLWSRVITTAVAIEAIVAIAVPWTTIAPAYRTPDTLSVEQIPESALSFHTRYGDAIALVAYELEDISLEPGESTMVTLYWQALAPVDRDYSVYLHLFGRDGEMIAFRDSLAGMALYPSSRWKPGEVIRDSYELRISPDATGPVAARLNAGLYLYPTMERLPVSDGLGREVLQPTLGYIKIEGAGNALDANYALDYTLGDGVRLVGYDLEESRVAAGQNLRLTLYWETAPLEAEYTVFVHLVNADGRLLGQGDGPPMAGQYPTTYWGTGESIIDVHDLLIEADAPSGEAIILVGLYREDGQRLPVSLHGQPAGDSAFITTVAISEP